MIHATPLSIRVQLLNTLYKGHQTPFIRNKLPFYIKVDIERLECPQPILFKTKTQASCSITGRYPRCLFVLQPHVGTTSLLDRLQMGASLVFTRKYAILIRELLGENTCYSQDRSTASIAPTFHSDTLLYHYHGQEQTLTVGSSDWYACFVAGQQLRQTLRSTHFSMISSLT
jgi:hypothetical protein